MVEKIEKGMLSQVSCVYLLLLEIIEKLTNEKLILTIFRFIFGKKEQPQKVISLDVPLEDDFNFELAKLSFKAKNQACSMRIHDPENPHTLFLNDIEIEKTRQNHLQQLIEDDIDQIPDISMQSSAYFEDSSFMDESPGSELMLECFRTNLKLQIDEFGNKDDKIRLINLLILD